jgi:hypothetical protein
MNTSLRFIYLMTSLLIPQWTLSQDALVTTSSIDINDTAEIIKLIDNRVNLIIDRALTCKGNIPSDLAGLIEHEDQYSHSATKCDQHDSVLFSGLGCLAVKLAEFAIKNDPQKKQFLNPKAIEYGKKRCRDVYLSQMPIREETALAPYNGKFVRGQTKTFHPPVDMSFSRDHGLGVFATYIAALYHQEISQKDQVAQVNLQKAKKSAMDWAEYIDREQEGKRMCDRKSIGSGCHIFQGKGYPSLMKRTFLQLGIMTDDKKNQGPLRNKLADQNYNPRGGRNEMRFHFSDGYQIHLKSVGMLLHSMIDLMIEKPTNSEIKDRHYFEHHSGVPRPTEEFRKQAKALFKKSEVNPWFELLHHGPHLDLITSVFNVYCPAKLRRENDLINPHFSDSGYAWQSKRTDIGWEVGDGHDCIFLLEMMKAMLLKTYPAHQLPTERKGCPNGAEKNKHIGEYGGLKVCKKNKWRASQVRCGLKGGVVRYKEGDQFKTAGETIGAPEVSFAKMADSEGYCLQRNDGFYFAWKIQRICPWPRKFLTFYNRDDEVGQFVLPDSIYDRGTFPLMPVCGPGLFKKMALWKCHNEIHRIPIHLTANHTQVAKPNSKENITHCLINKGNFFVQKKIGRKCKNGREFLGYKQAWNWAMCKHPEKKTLAQCGSHPIEKGHCLLINEKNSYFDAHPISDLPVVKPDTTKEVESSFETIVQRWSLGNIVTHREFDSKSIENGHTTEIKLRGLLTFRTLADRAGDIFFTKMYYVDSTGHETEIKQEIDTSQTNSPVKNVVVQFNRRRNSMVNNPSNSLRFSGAYETPYSAAFTASDPNGFLIFRTYLLRYGQGLDTAQKVFEIKEPLLIRNVEVVPQKSDIRIFPNPATNLSLVNVRLKLQPTLLTDNQNLSAYQVRFSVYSSTGQRVHQSQQYPLERGEKDYPLGTPNLHLPKGIYFLKAELLQGSVFMKQIASSQLIITNN